MPVYEYVCTPCDVRFEKYVRSWSEEARCPRCEGEVEKQLSTFAMASASGGSAAPAPRASMGGRACCGGGCGCRH